MYICCALVGTIKDSVCQNARCNNKKIALSFAFVMVHCVKQKRLSKKVLTLL